MDIFHQIQRNICKERNRGAVKLVPFHGMLLFEELTGRGRETAPAPGFAIL